MNKENIRSFAAILLLLFACANYSGAQKIEIKRPIEIKLDREKMKKVPTVSVNIKNKNYTFVFDSGAAVTMISPEIATEIGCEPFGSLAGFDAGGGMHKMKRCDDVEINVGGFATKLDAVVGDASMFFPKDAPRIDGFISLQTFDNRVLTLDLAKNILIVESEKSFKKKTRAMKGLQSRLSRELGGYGVDVFFALKSSKGKVWMLLDTGNTNRLLLAPHAQEQLGIELDKSKEKTAKNISLDLIGFGNFEAEAREREMIYDGMLNYDTIAKMLITMDLRTGKSWAKANL